VHAPDDSCGAWNPGVLSRIPREWLPLATIHRRENVFNDLALAEELAALTGLPLSELAVFRPERLALHELLIRVTADFAVPDGSRIEDLGINFRRIASRILTRYLEPEMPALVRVFEDTRRAAAERVEAALLAAGIVRETQRVPERRGLAALFRRGMRPAAPAQAADWGAAQILDCQRRAGAPSDEESGVVFQALSRVLSGLFASHGQAWGGRELIVPLVTDLACNVLGSDAIGRAMDPILARAAAEEGFGLLPCQDKPIVINTKGASASGKSTLRPLQKRLAGDIGASWSDFALISPDIWRKQLLDYGSLGPAYKYAGALAAEELQVVDCKLDRYMAGKHARGRMSHLLIDRFRFDSFAPDSDEEGSNLLTRFARAAFLFFVITPPEALVERAWKRGLEFGRYKAVDDTLAHGVKAYTGIPNVFFTWIRRSDKSVRFEFLDNTVAFGERPRTAAFGDNDTANILDVGRMIDIDRYARVFVDARSPDQLYPDRALLAPSCNLGFLTRCVREFRRVNFADQASGRVYLTVESGRTVFVDMPALVEAARDPDTLAGLSAVAPEALDGGVIGGTDRAGAATGWTAVGGTAAGGTPVGGAAVGGVAVDGTMAATAAEAAAPAAVYLRRHARDGSEPYGVTLGRWGDEAS
jgi:hypothetical protein